MTQPALRLVSDTGEVVEQAEAQEWRERYEAANALLVKRDATIEAQAAQLQKKQYRIRELEGEFADRATNHAKAADVRDVLLYHRERFLSMNAAVVPDSAGWRKVTDRLEDMDVATGKPAFDVESLCESVDGARLDGWYTEKPHRKRAEYLFRDASTVQRNLERHAELLGQAPHDFFNLPAPGHVVEWLSEECDCGHVRAQHLQCAEGCTATVGRQVCGCDGLRTLEDRFKRWREAQMSSRGDGSDVGRDGTSDGGGAAPPPRLGVRDACRPAERREDES